MWKEVLSDLGISRDALQKSRNVKSWELPFRYIIPFLVLSERTDDGFQSGQFVLAVLREGMGARDGASAMWIEQTPEDEWRILMDKLAFAVPVFRPGLRAEMAKPARRDTVWRELATDAMRAYVRFWKFSGERVAEYKSQAYQNVVDYIASGAPLPETYGELLKIRGIGKGIAEKLARAAVTGRVPRPFEGTDAVLGAFIDEALNIRTLGPAVVQRAAKLGVRDMASFLDFSRELHLTANQIWSVENRKMISARTKRSRLEGVISDLELALPEDTKSAIAGSWRRGKGAVGDLDLLVEGKPSHSALVRIYDALDNSEMLCSGYDGRPRSCASTKMTVYLRRGDSAIQLDVRIIPGEQWPLALTYFTGSREYGVGLRRRARDMGMKLSEYSLVYRDSVDPAAHPVHVGSEAVLWMLLGLSFVPPEGRSHGLGKTDPPEGRVFLADGQRCPRKSVMNYLGSLRSRSSGKEVSRNIWQGVCAGGASMFAASAGIPLLWEAAPWQFCIGDLGDCEDAHFSISGRDVKYWVEDIFGLDPGDQEGFLGYFSGKTVILSGRVGLVRKLLFGKNTIRLE